MDPVSNVDRLVLLLRQKLQERSKSVATRRRDPNPAPTGMDRLQALAAIDGLEERQLRRALIQNILSDQFGVQLINEAKFQQVVDRVTEAIEADPDAARLMIRVISELKDDARRL